MNAVERDMDDEETREDVDLAWVSRRYSDPRLRYVEENEEDEK